MSRFLAAAMVTYLICYAIQHHRHGGSFGPPAPEVAAKLAQQHHDR